VGERELRTREADELAPSTLELLNFTLVVTWAQSSTVRRTAETRTQTKPQVSERNTVRY